MFMHTPSHFLRQLTLGCLFVYVTFSIACTKNEPSAPADKTETVVFPTQAPIPVTFTLQKEEGQTGRATPIGNNYRPQVRFSSSDESTCTLNLPTSVLSVEPGQTTDASFACDMQIKVEPHKQEFAAFEGGKQVGHGIVQLPQ